METTLSWHFLSAVALIVDSLQSLGILDGIRLRVLFVISSDMTLSTGSSLISQTAEWQKPLFLGELEHCNTIFLPFPTRLHPRTPTASVSPESLSTDATHSWVREQHSGKRNKKLEVEEAENQQKEAKGIEKAREQWSTETEEKAKELEHTFSFTQVSEFLKSDKS